VGGGALIPRWLKALLLGPSDSEIATTLVRGVLLGAILFVVRFGNRIVDEGWSYAQVNALSDAGISFFIGGLISTAVAAFAFYARILTNHGKTDD
jgi:nucleoside permease NupC